MWVARNRYMLACVIAAEWIVKDNSQFYKNHHNFPKKHFITISHIKKLKNVVRYVQHVFREHQAIHETCDFFESLFSLVKLFVRYTLFFKSFSILYQTFSNAQWSLVSASAVLAELCNLKVICALHTHTRTHTRIPFDQVQYLAHALARRGNTHTHIPFDQVQYLAHA